MRLQAACVFATLVVLAPLASADDSVAKADALFAEGKALMASDLHGACAKFETASQLNPHAIGILLNAALCDEKLGRVATAVARFTVARAIALEQHLPEHLSAANEHLAALGPRVPHVSFTTTVLPPNTTIVIDDKQIVELTSLANIAVDPGAHEVEVAAPGYLPRVTRFAIAETEHRDIELPTLDRATSSSRARKTAGIVVGVSGIALGVTSLVLGRTANTRYNTAWDHGMCSATPVRHCDNADDVSKINTARTLGNVATVVGIVGVAAIGAGAFLYLRAPKTTSSERGVALVPQLDRQSAGIAAVGRF